MLNNPVVAHAAKFVNVSGTFGEDDHHQRDNASDQRHRRSYPEHSALSVNTSGCFPSASRCLFGTLVGSEVCLRGWSGEPSTTALKGRAMKRKSEHITSE